MGTETYSVRRLDSDPEVLRAEDAPKIAPFPVRRWNEPLPIAAEGREFVYPREEKSPSPTLARFYPPLLLLSTGLTGIFFWLYLTKPIVISNESDISAPQASSVLAAEQALAASSVEEVDPELSPFPDEFMLPSDELPGRVVSHGPSSPAMIPTTLEVEKIFEVKSLGGDLEAIKISLPVVIPETAMEWSEETVAEAERLVGEIEVHLQQVSALQAAGVKLLESWNALASEARPQEILQAEKETALNEN